MASFGPFENLALVFLLVALNGFFVATEFAIVSVRRTRVNELVNQRRFGARYLQGAVHELDRYIAGTQVGITLSSLALGWIGEPAVARLIEPLFSVVPGLDSPTVIHSTAVAVGFLFITFLHVVLGELVPKSLALQMPDRVALAVSAPMTAIVVLLQPLIWSLNGIGNWILRQFGVEPAGHAHTTHSVEELEILVQQSHEAGVLDELEQEILQRTFRFSEITAGEIMVRRVDMEAVDIGLPVEQILDDVANSIHSRFPVYETSMDTIIGILHVHDLFRATRKGHPPTSIRPFCRPCLIVPSGLPLDALLVRFQQQRTQMAIVVDEYGGTAGLVTYEDIVEEVTGEVQDDPETDIPSIQHLADGRILLRGDLRLDEVNQTLEWELSDDEVDTIAGYIMKKLGRVAKVDDEVETPYGILKVCDMARMRILRASVLPLPEDPSSDSESSS